MRRKAKKKKPWICEETRHIYAKTHRYDELEEHLRGPLWAKVLESDTRVMLDTHHVMHVGGVRWDRFENLLSITRRSHDYLHQIEPGADVAVYYSKLHGRRRVVRDRIREFWRSQYGRDVVLFVQALRDGGKVPPYYVEYVEAICELF